MSAREQVGGLGRRERTVILLETRTAWMRPPRSQFASFGAVPGEKATERKPCNRCDRDGKINTRQGLEECPDCHGRGFYLVDGYTGKREPERKAAQQLSGADRAAWRQQVEAELSRLDLQLATPSEVSSRTLEDEKPEAWERDRDRHFRAGDYRKLDLALEWLGGRQPAAQQLVTWVYEYRVIRLGHATNSLKRLAETAVDLLNTKMPEEIRVPHWYLPSTEAEAYRRRRQAA